MSIRPVIVVIGVWLLLAASAQSGEPPQEQAITAEKSALQLMDRLDAPTSTFELTRDVVFGTGGGRPLKMHILRSKTASGGLLPVVVRVHGGGWRTGSHNQEVQGLVAFAQQGYLSVAIEYRLSGEAVFPAQIEDVKCSIRFLRAKAKQFNLDPDRIGVLGSSAGGHLAALLGTTTNVKEFEGTGGWPEFSSRPTVICDWCGPTYLVPEPDSSRTFIDLAGKLIGGSLAEHKELALKASPMSYVTKDALPFFIVHGDKDETVDVKQSEILHAALQKAGVESTLQVIPGGSHASPASTMKITEEFFAKHLKQPVK